MDIYRCLFIVLACRRPDVAVPSARNAPRKASGQARRRSNHVATITTEIVRLGIMNHDFSGHNARKVPYPLEKMAKQGVATHTLAWREDFTRGTQAKDFPELSGVLSGLPPDVATSKHAPHTWLAESMLVTIFCRSPFRPCRHHPRREVRELVLERTIRTGVASRFPRKEKDLLGILRECRLLGSLHSPRRRVGVVGWEKLVTSLALRVFTL